MRRLFAAATLAAVGIFGLGYYCSRKVNAASDGAHASSPSGHEERTMPFSSDDVRAGLHDFFREATYHVRNAPEQDEVAEEAARREQEAERRQGLVAQIADELARRDEDIDRMADEDYHRDGCSEMHRNGEDFGKMQLRASALEMESTLAGPVEHLERMLRTLRGDDTYDHSSTVAKSFPFRIARSRYYERCLGEEGKGLFDLYQEHFRDIKERNCDDAAALAMEAGDVYSRLQVTHNCIPREWGDASGEMVAAALRNRFYEEVAAIPEGEIETSARFALSEEYEGWLTACIANRAERYPAHSLQLATCLTDLYHVGSVGAKKIAAFAGIDEAVLRGIVAGLSPEQEDTRCYIKAMLGDREPSDCRDPASF